MSLIASEDQFSVNDSVSPESPGKRKFFSRFARNPRTAISVTVLAVVFLLAFVGPLINPIDYRSQIGVPLSGDGILGTDDFGRDVLSRLLVATRTSLIVSVFSVALALVVGVALGLVAGFLGGFFAVIVMRGADILLSFPAVILAIATVAILGPQLQNVVLVIGVLYVPRFTRVIYAQVVSLRGAQYVDAERVNGTPTWRIIAGTIFPNVLATVIVQASLSLSFAIQVEAGLSFLGLGAQPPLASLGTMIAAGRDFLEVQPTLLIYPAAVLVLIVLSVNILGDGLRDVLDPRRFNKQI